MMLVITYNTSTTLSMNFFFFLRKRKGMIKLFNVRYYFEKEHIFSAKEKMKLRNSYGISKFDN